MFEILKKFKYASYKNIYNNYDYKTVKSKIVLSLKLVLRKYHRQELSRQILITFSLFTIFSFLIIFFSYFFYDVQNSSGFLETNTCPACMGFKACEKFQRKEIRLSLASTIKALFYSSSYIYKGLYSNGSQLVISRIASSTQIASWEEKICLKAKRKRNCRVKEAALGLFPMSGSRWMSEGVKGHSLSLTCPSTRMLDSMAFRYAEKHDSIDISTTERIRMVLTTWLNPRSIIYQMFPNENGWFFPKYEGSCGRIAVYKMPGSPLYTYLTSPWNVRVKLALSLLKIAHKSTTNNHKYALYLMKCEMQDFYVNEDDLEVTYHEAENVLLVDTWEMEKSKTKEGNSTYILQHSECLVKDGDERRVCVNEYETQVDQLCHNKYSDYNFYMMCRNIFTPKIINTSPRVNAGLLHGTPPSIDSLHGITQLLEKCIQQASLSESRSQIVTKLIEVLTEIVNDLNLEKDF